MAETLLEMTGADHEALSDGQRDRLAEWVVKAGLNPCDVSVVRDPVLVIEKSEAGNLIAHLWEIVVNENIEPDEDSWRGFPRHWPMIDESGDVVVTRHSLVVSDLPNLEG